MDDSIDQSLQLYNAARDAMNAGKLAEALEFFEASLAKHIHHKTLELIGELHHRQGRPRDAIIPLAAATGLNRGPRAPSILAEAFLALEEWADAEEAASESLRRDPNCRRAAVARDAARQRLNDR
jgi:tetratricopeptide (TPR) repeat protein